MLRLILSRLYGVPNYLKVAVGVFVLMAAIACGSSAPASTAVPTPTAEPAASSNTASDASSETIKVGVLHSLSGTMSISETAVKDATLMAI